MGVPTKSSQTFAIGGLWSGSRSKYNFKLETSACADEHGL